MLTATLFPHLAPDATWAQRQDAGDRMRAVYSKDAAKVQAAIIGEANVHLGDRRVMWDHTKKRTYVVGLGYAFMMGRAFIGHRILARQRDADRRHYVRNALRIRRALCCCGLNVNV